MTHIFLFGFLILPFCDAFLPTRSLNNVKIRSVTPPIQFGDNPHWDERQQVLYFVDTFEQNIYRFDPFSGDLTYVSAEGGPVSVAITTQNDNQIIATIGRYLVAFSWDGFSSPGPLTVLATVDGDKPNNRFNDGAADAYGRLWIGTNSIFYNEDPVSNAGRYYSFSANENYRPKVQIQGTTVSNGIGWSNDDSLIYLTDSTTRKVYGYQFDLQRGALGKRFIVFDLAQYGIKGVPTGMAVDEKGLLWVTIYNGARVIQINPSNGVLLRTIPLPVSKLTNCAFGGPNLSTLYVTSIRTPGESPSSGSLYAVDGLGVRGQKKRNTAVGPFRNYASQSGWTGEPDSIDTYFD